MRAAPLHAKRGLHRTKLPMCGVLPAGGMYYAEQTNGHGSRTAARPVFRFHRKENLPGASQRLSSPATVMRAVATTFLPQNSAVATCSLGRKQKLESPLLPRRAAIGRRL